MSFFNTLCIKEIIKGNILKTKMNLSIDDIRQEINNGVDNLWNPITKRWVLNNKPNLNSIVNKHPTLYSFTSYSKITCKTISENTLEINLNRGNVCINIENNEFNIVYYLPYPSSIVAPYVIIKSEWINNIGTNKCPFKLAILCTNPIDTSANEYMEFYDVISLLLDSMMLFKDNTPYINHCYNYNKNILLRCLEFINTFYINNTHIIDENIYTINSIINICEYIYDNFSGQLKYYSKYVLFKLYSILSPQRDINNMVLTINMIDLINHIIDIQKKKIINPLNKIRECIEKYTDNIPEGDYLLIMNCLKDIYDS